MQEPPRQPPIPPPLPVQPLGYATPFPQMPQTNTRFHQAAKASWVAPVIAFGLSCLARGMKDESFEASAVMVMRFAYVGLIIGGWICGIVALCGIGRAGKRGILAPAIVGVTLNTLVLLLVAFGFIAGMRSRTAAKAAVRAPTPVTSPQSALRQTGWVGAYAGPQYRVTVIAFSEGHADTLDLLSNFNVQCSPLVVTVDNRSGTSSFTVSDGATLRFADGKVINALRSRDVLGSAKRDSAKWMTDFGMPFTVNIGATVDAKFLFIPPGLDLSNLKSITLTIDGQPRILTGEIVTADEKTARMNKAKQQGIPGQ